ncbi:hypothetical protein [Neobacillus vireti]|uniref:hypothetical protein n=1 Tax=Neobacillus vireti TaxID=220686 RepID=UPI002FFEB67A
MLTFDEKLTIIESYPQLERKDVSLKRINFQLPNSISDKKNIVYHLHPNGNGFVYAGHLDHYETDDKGMVNIRDFSAEQLRSILTESIAGLSQQEKSINEEAIIGELEEERWVNEEGNILVLLYESEVWNIYFGLNLEESFDTYEEAIDFMQEEGFKPEKK